MDPIHSEMLGYWWALCDFGIWKDGVQRIGCLETPIKEAMLSAGERIWHRSPHETEEILSMQLRVEEKRNPNPSSSRGSSPEGSEAAQKNLEDR